jgi:hypothetical protein
MKSNLQTIQHEGTLGDEGRVRMGLDSNSIAHLMAVLTDLYSDPQMAILREYSTNAYDSHLEAGQTRPIEVELPSELAPNLVIRDFGVGMSVDTVLNQFSQYGFSSKRDTDEQVGMLGLGCKSALSHTNQFTMTSVHQGVKATVLITRTEDGAGAVQVVDTVGTTEPNGVEVRVPGSYHDFADRAQRFFQFWEPGTVLVNGEQPESVWCQSDTVVLDPDVVLAEGLDWHVLVMGNVPYPVTNYEMSRLFGYFGSHHVVARVPIGSVNFTPSREELHYTSLTKDAVRTTRDFARERVVIEFNRNLAAQPTHLDALRYFNKHGSVLPQPYLEQILRYDGESLPIHGWLAPRPTLDFPVNAPSYGQDKASTIQNIKVNDAMHTALWITDSTARGVSGSIKAKARHYCKVRGITTGSIKVLPGLPSGPWLQGVRTVTVDDIKAIKIPGEAQAPKSKTAGQAFTVISGDGSLEVFDAEQDEIVCWFPAGGDLPRGVNKRRLAEAIGGRRIANVPKRSEAKFAEAHPEVPRLVDWLRQEYAAAAEALPQMEVLRMEYHAGAAALAEFANLDPAQVADPDLVELLGQVERRGNAERRAWDRIARTAEWFNITPPATTEAATALGERCDEIVARYPALAHMHLWRADAKDAAYDYIRDMRDLAELKTKNTDK